MRARPWLAKAAVVLCGCGQNAEPTPPPTIQQQLQQALETVVDELGAPGATLAVTIPDAELWIGAAGFADLDQAVAMQPAHRFRIGSITKTFTASVVLQLVEEQVLTLGDPLEQWYPGFPNGPAITVEHLLRHTTGIYDVAYHGDVVSQPEREWDPAELVALAAAEPPLFEPGQDWAYSNTNFILLGLVVEAATGNSWAHEVRSRLLDPLALGDTFVETDEAIPGGMARGYFVDDDFTDWYSPTIGWAAGAMVANAADLVTWLDALLGGEVLEPGSLEQMRTPTALPGDRVATYGMGLDIDASELGPATLYGHSGDSILYRSYLYENEPADVTVVALVNGYPWFAADIAAVAWDLMLDGLEPR